MSKRLRYVIKFVADMGRAVRFYRDVLGLPLKYESPKWSELVTGETTLALHAASDKNPPGTLELGFTVPDLEAFYKEMTAKRGWNSASFPRRKNLVGCWRSSWIPKEHTAVSMGLNGLYCIQR
jgi:catechol 2,3-dioxygenase-like lactoylglutathione lyase family enzyme